MAASSGELPRVAAMKDFVPFSPESSSIGAPRRVGFRFRALAGSNRSRCQARIEKLAKDLEHIDGVLAFIAPDFVAESIRPRIFTPPQSSSK